MDLAEYAPINHTHDNYCYFIPFRIVNSDLMYITCPIEPNYAMVLEDINEEIFSIREIRGNYVILEQYGADENKVYHLLVSKVTYPVKQAVTISIDDITANQGDTVELLSMVNDENNVPVEIGDVNYTLWGD